MAITDKEQGVWNVDQVYNKQMEGNIWVYSEPMTAWSWGTNAKGQLGQNQGPGNGDNDATSSPVQIGADSDWIFMNTASGSGMGSALIKRTGEMYTFGHCTYGQLGQNNIPTGERSSPTQLGTENTWESVSNSYGQSMVAIKTAGTMWSWGDNGEGQLGLDHRAPRSSPMQISGTTWANVQGATASDSESGFMAVRTDGTLWTWGGGENGRLGYVGASETSRSSPVNIGTGWGVGPNKMAYGQYAAAAIKANGTVWTWGNNNSGFLGLNQNANDILRSSPNQVGTDTDWSKIACMRTTVLALRTNGTLWTWGNNQNGRCAQNSTSTGYYSSPVQVGTGTDWSDIMRQGGWNTSLSAIKTDGTLWAWGLNEYGPLGQNSQVDYSSPVQIPGEWGFTTGGYYANMGIKINNSGT